MALVKMLKLNRSGLIKSLIRLAILIFLSGIIGTATPVHGLPPHLNKTEAAQPSKVATTSKEVTPPVTVVEAVQPEIPAPMPEDQAKAYIYQHESGNNPESINQSSGACGLGQALPCSKLPCSLSDYACQDAWFTDYMLSRYGSWANAQSFWEANGYW